MEFSICGRNVVITDDELYSHKLHTVFKDRARNASRKFVEKYRAYQGWSTFVASAPKDGYQIIADEAEFAAEILVKEGKYAVTGDALLAKYGDTVFEPWNQVVNDLAELLEQVHESEKEAELARELRKNSRGRVIGGGFGVSGAVKGMAFAGAANLVTGSVHSIANAIGNAKTRNEIARQEAKLYQNEDFVRYLRDQIYNGVLTLGGCVAAEHGVDAEIVQPRNPEFTASLMKNYGLVPENDRLEVLFHALENNVYEIQVYEHLLKEFDHSEEAAQIGRLFGLGVEIDRICVDVLTKLVPSESDLSARSMEENLTLLDVYRRKKERLGYPDTKGVALPVSWGPTEGACLYFETAKGSSCSITMNLFFFKQGLFYQIGFESFDREDCLSACVEILNSVEVVGYPLEGFDAKNMISRSPTDVYTPYVEADRGIIVNTEYYTATLPLSWFDCYVRSIDWEGYRYALRFYEVNSYQDAWETAMQSGTYNTYEEYAELVGTQNGLLFEILIRMQGDDLSDLGDYIIWKSLDIDGEMCDIIIHYPHEETYSAATEARYLRMKQDIPQILDSLALR